jgi:steroid 5-alpha reductase family enzyme
MAFKGYDMKTAIAIVAALLILVLIAWFAVSAARGNNG